MWLSHGHWTPEFMGRSLFPQPSGSGIFLISSIILIIYLHLQMCFHGNHNFLHHHYSLPVLLWCMKFANSFAWAITPCVLPQFSLCPTPSIFNFSLLLYIPSKKKYPSCAMRSHLYTQSHNIRMKKYILLTLSHQTHKYWQVSARTKQPSHCTISPPFYSSVSFGIMHIWLVFNHDFVKC